jgi:hypothetical protein
MVRRISLIFLAGSVLLASACEKEAPPPQYRIVTLPSGKQVKTLGVGQINFPQSGPALMLRYISDVPISDTLALGREADEIWTGFRIDVENARLNSAILSANSPPSGGLVSRSQGYNFVFQRGPDGRWSRAGQE